MRTAVSMPSMSGSDKLNGLLNVLLRYIRVDWLVRCAPQVAVLDTLTDTVLTSCPFTPLDMCIRYVQILDRCDHATTLRLSLQMPPHPWLSVYTAHLALTFS